MIIDTIVDNPLEKNEIDDAKNVYVGSDEQPLTYETPPPYAEIVSNLIASMSPKNLLEFGCNAGRNLALIRDKCPSCVLTGVDVNPNAIDAGKKIYNLDLSLADENWIYGQATDTFDVSLTISVIDHMPYPEAILRELLRVTKKYLILFELAHDRIGRATHNLMIEDGKSSLTPTYRYSYIHDYRHECENKFGANCILDVKFPIGEANLLDLYRLYVFSKDQRFRSFSPLKSISFDTV